MAINIPTGQNQNLSLGFKGLIRWQRINLDGLLMGSQYLTGHGFDPALDNGEIPQPFNNKFFTLSSGFLWQQTDRKGKVLKQFGFSFFDFNKPDPTFLDGSQDELPSTLVAHGSWMAMRQNQLSLYPEFLMTHSSTRTMALVGGKFQFDIEKTKHIDVLLKYAVARSGIVGIQLHRDNFSFGMSYDFPVFTKNAGNLGAFELGLEYRSPVDPMSKRDAAKRKQSKRKKDLAKKKGQQQAKKPPVLVSATPATDSVHHKQAANKLDDRDLAPIDSFVLSNPAMEITEGRDPTAEATAGNISHEPLLIEKITLHFGFDYNSTDLDEETEKFLGELSKTLIENPNLSAKIIGHTDNVGAAHLNHRLSLKRAEAVKKYLLKLGVANIRLVSDGKGMDEPLNENLNDEERAKNRRVEIKLMTGQ